MSNKLRDAFFILGILWATTLPPGFGDEVPDIMMIYPMDDFPGTVEAYCISGDNNPQLTAQKIPYDRPYPDITSDLQSGRKNFSWPNEKVYAYRKAQGLLCYLNTNRQYDVMAPLMDAQSKNVPRRLSSMVNKDEDLVIDFEKTSSGTVYWQAETTQSQSWNWAAVTDKKLEIPYDKVDSTGIYLVRPRWEASQKTFGAVAVIKRKCPRERYGYRCQEWCPDCWYGGVCHDRTGKCVCPPGRTGDHCENACEGEVIGRSCNVNLGSLNGVQICLPYPYGCSCAPGFKGFKCNEECEEGRWGVDCLQTCAHCSSNNCHRVTGICAPVVIGKPALDLQLNGEGNVVATWTEPAYAVGNIFYLYKYKKSFSACTYQGVLTDYSQRISKTSVVIPVQPYTSLQFILWFGNEEGLNLNRVVKTISSESKVPSNEVTGVSCNSTGCQVSLEENCEKVNGDGLTIFYEFEPVEERIRNDKQRIQRGIQSVNVNTDGNSKYVFNVNLPDDLLSYTKYKFTPYAANVVGRNISSGRKTVTFHTKPKEPDMTKLYLIIGLISLICVLLPFGMYGMCMIYRQRQNNGNNPPNVPSFPGVRLSSMEDTYHTLEVLRPTTRTGPLIPVVRPSAELIPNSLNNSCPTTRAGPSIPVSRPLSEHIYESVSDLNLNASDAPPFPTPHPSDDHIYDSFPELSL